MFSITKLCNVLRISRFFCVLKMQREEPTLSSGGGFVVA